MSDAIVIKNLKKTFNGTEYVLKGIDLRIPKGKITVLIGYSGTGKSVLLKHLLGLLKPTDGSIEVLGKNLQEMDNEELIRFRCNYGMLFQDAALFDDHTMIENVLFPINEYRRDLSVADRREIAIAKLTQVGLEAKSYDKLPSELSGGMRKRCGLARALALDPEIILYDEPTTGLDPIMTETVDNLILNTHNHREGVTSVVITHDLYAAFRLAHFVAMLDNGKVLLSGTPQDFLKSDIDLVKRFVEKGIKHS